MTIDLSVIIVNWNSREYLKACLASLYERAKSVTFEVVVIDSGSYDGCDAMLRECFPQVRFIQSETNLGFARANNTAYLASSGEAVLFLNPDTEVVGAAIDTLLERLWTLPDCGAVGGTLLNSDSSIQSTSIQAAPTILNKLLDSDVLKQRWRTSSLWGMAPLYDGGTGARAVESISGACLLVRRDVFEQVGRFSEEYLMYAEDVDLSHKIRQAGYRNYYVPEAVVVHHGGSSSKESASTFAAVMMPEATLRFFKKTRGERYARRYRATMFIAALGRLVALGFAVPFHMGASRFPRWKASCRKWLAVLGWSLSRSELVRRYYPATERPTAR